MVAVLTRHSVRRNGGTQTWVTSRSRYRGGTGRSPCAAEGSVTAAGWTDWFPPGLPGPQFHSPHQNCKHKKITIKLLGKNPGSSPINLSRFFTSKLLAYIYIYLYTGIHQLQTKHRSIPNTGLDSSNHDQTVSITKITIDYYRQNLDRLVQNTGNSATLKPRRQSCQLSRIRREPPAILSKILESPATVSVSRREL